MEEVAGPVLIDENDEFTRPSTQKPSSSLTALVIRISGGYVKTETQAQYILLAVAVTAILLSVLSLVGSNGHTAKIIAPPGMQVYAPGDAPPRLVPAP